MQLGLLLAVQLGLLLAVQLGLLHAKSSADHVRVVYGLTCFNLWATSGWSTWCGAVSLLWAAGVFVLRSC